MAEIKVACDRHSKSRMLLTRIDSRTKSGEPVSYQCYMCEREGCFRCYLEDAGYFDNSPGQALSFLLNGRQCSEHSDWFLYLDLTGKWHCPESGCEIIS